ncbi:hypothetical protein OJAV_G00084200 [Oryzias javanicus]|uniref:Uncharacterized protein n=1 Tax=Oryzias javanicus TaxID=123683 RepID=A0A3S2MZI6_ORYJA|nr:hypothetical protein OJAV_G00084200 [Oryzias javanicus]
MELKATGEASDPSPWTGTGHVVPGCTETLTLTELLVLRADPLLHVCLITPHLRPSPAACCSGAARAPPRAAAAVDCAVALMTRVRPRAAPLAAAGSAAGATAGGRSGAAEGRLRFRCDTPIPLQARHLGRRALIGWN